MITDKNVTIKFLELPVIIIDIANHNILKKPVLNAIKKTVTMSINSPNSLEVISNTDYFIPNNFKKFYVPLIDDVISTTINTLQQTLNPGGSIIKPGSTWFQQYEKGDYHGWHTHGGNTYYSCVYYVDLPDQAPKTTFKVLDKQYEFEIKEGTVICFPGLVEHCSKPNESDYCKTVIAFNTFLQDEPYCNV